MPESLQSARPRVVASYSRVLLGPLVTLATVIACEAVDHTPLFIPNPASLLAITIAAAAAYGGWLPGLVSAAISFAYAAWYFSIPGQAFHYTHEDYRKVQILALALPSLALIVGWVQARATRAVRMAAESAAARDLQHVLDHAQDAVFMTDAQNRFFHVNQGACVLTGYAYDELVSMHGYELLDRASLPPGYDPGAALQHDGRAILQLQLLRKDSSRVPVEIHASRLADGRVIGIVRDVTTQVRMVEELRDALALVNATLESTADGILVVDAAGRIVRCNERFGRMWIIDADRLAVGEDAQSLEDVRRQLADPTSFLATVTELYARPEADSFDTIEFIDGRVFERFSQPHRVEGRIVGRVWSFRDVTVTRRQSEALRESESRFLQAQKLEAIGRLAGGVAHDFNNMLTAILGESELLLLQLPSGSPLREQVEHIRSAAQRSAGLTRQLLAFGRRQPGQPRAFALAEVASGLEPLLRRLSGPAIVFRIEPSAETPWVFADPGQLEQALINLVINAHDAMPDGGLLTVRIGVDDVREADRARRGARRTGPHGWFEVVDTGVGIPAHVLPHLFEPFFTTKSPGKGTGLGLASVYAVVEQNGGFIEVDSVPEKGATFRVLVPTIASPMMPPVASQAHAMSAPLDAVRDGRVAATTLGTVLLAEDEGSVRTFVAAVLRQLGYTVLEARNGEEALALALSYTDTIDLLLTDVVMPGKNGPEVALQLARERPSIRVVLMSGYAGDALAGLGVHEQRFAMLPKPFGSEALARIVREAMTDPARR